MRYKIPGKDTGRRRIIEILYKQGPLHYRAIGELIGRNDDPNVASVCASLTQWPHFWLKRVSRGEYDLTPEFRLHYQEASHEQG
jgi:hypothetical protein